MKFVFCKERSKFCTDIYCCQDIFHLHYEISFHLNPVYVNISPGEFWVFWDLLLSLPSCSVILWEDVIAQKKQKFSERLYGSLHSIFFGHNSYSTQDAVKSPGATALLSC